jgi:predicted ATPase/class 3 adenylate cyclase
LTDLPTGTVTFLFTDIEGATRLLQELGEGYRAVQDRHSEIIRQALDTEGGREVRTEGDSFFVVFRTAAQAVRAAVAAQRDLAHEAWPHGRPLRVRMGMHTGEGALGGGDYIGIDVNRAARIAAAGHGGQVVLSDATRVLAGAGLPAGVTVRNLGRYRLKDFDEPQPLHDLVVDGLQADFAPIRTLGGPRRTNLPPPRTSLVGREREVAEIDELLTRTRLLTLTGPGGTGKTRLALRVAADQLDRVEDGVYMVDLSSVLDPARVASKIASSLGVREEPGADLLDTLAGHFRDRDLLLVLDNFEHVVEAAPAIGRLVDAAPRLRVLVTSRAPLRLSGEHEYLVGPLPLPDAAQRIDKEALSTSESVKLFVERAASVRRDFRLTDENAAAVAEIVRRVDGLPLAIELAAGRVKMLSPQALRDRLTHRLPLLARGPRGVPERQKTLRGAIEWSYDLLGPEERRLFARLAAFRGGWTLDSSEAVCAPGLDIGVMEGLTSLVDNSLIRQEQVGGGEVRFGMLETIHEYAAERLDESGELDDTARRHARHMRDLAEEAEPQLAGEDQATWLERLEREHDNVRAALEWAEAAPDADTALRTAAAIWRFWQLGAHLAEARARLERILALPGAEVRGAARVRALGALGGILYWQNDYEAMWRPYQQAVDIAREVGDPSLLARALFDLSFAPFVTAQDFERQEQLLGQALAAAPEDERVLRAEISTYLGFLTAFQGGDPSAGIKSVEAAIAIHRARGDRLLTAEHLFRLAGLKLLGGDSDAARGHLRQSVALLAELRSPAVVSVAMGLAASAFVASHEGDHERVARLLGFLSRIDAEGAGGPPPIFLRQFGDPEEAARAALGDGEFERAHAEGYAMTIDQARSYASELPERSHR